MVRSIIKRIIVAVSVALILGYIGSLNGFIVPFNVFAQGGGGGSSFDFDGIPLIGINDSTDSTKPKQINGLTSNVFYNQDTRYDFYYYQYAIAPGDSNYCSSESCYKLSNPTPGFFSNSINQSHIISNSTGGSIPSDERFVYVSSYYTTFTNSLKLKEGNHYTYLVVFNVDEGITLSPNDRNNFSLSAINISDNYNTLISYNIVNDVENLNVEYFRFDSEAYGDKTYAYLQVDFDLPDLQYNNYYLTDIWLEYNGYDSNPVNIPLNYLMYSRGDSTHNFTTDVYFLENAIVNFYGRKEVGYDYYYPSDYDVIDSINTCPDEFSIESIICNIKRVFTMIEKFFVRISNFFRELFDDSITWDLDSNSNMTPVSDLLTMPITLINSFITGFNGQCSNYTLGTLYNYSLTLPCINLRNYIGDTLFVIVDGLISMFMLLNIGRLIITFFDRSTSLDDMFGLLYHVHDYEVREADDYVNGVMR